MVRIPPTFAQRPGTVPARPAQPVPAQPVPAQPAPVVQPVPAPVQPTAAPAMQPIATASSSPPFAVSAAQPTPQVPTVAAPVIQLPTVRAIGALTVAMPDFMVPDIDDGLQAVAGYVRPPRIKVVQKQADRELLDSYYVGDILIVPDMYRVAPVMLSENPNKPGSHEPQQESERFFFVPLFFYPEFCVWNPFAARGTLPTIRERSLDERSAIARTCRNPAKWYAPCPELAGENIRYVEHMNFVCAIVEDDEVSGQPVVISFNKGMYSSGQDFAQLLQLRRDSAGRRGPIYGNVFQSFSKWQQSTKGDHYVLRVQNPEEQYEVSPFVTDAEQYQLFKTLALSLTQAHADKAIEVDYDDPNTVDAASTATSSPGRF